MTKLVLTLTAFVLACSQAEGQTSPNAIAGTAVTLTVQSGASPFSNSGTYRFLGENNGVYAIVGIKSVANSNGTYFYTKTGATTGQVNFTDSVAGPSLLNLTLTTASSGTYAITSSDGNTTLQTGKFTLVTDAAPAAVDGYTFNLVVQYGVAPLATAGKAKVVLAAGGNYTVTGTGGFPNSTGTFTEETVGVSGTHLSLTDSVAGAENLTLSWTNATSGTYVADTAQGIQAGTFTAAPPAAPVITSSKTAVAGLGVSFSYQIAASGYVLSYNATNLPAGLSVDTSTGIISGTPSALGVTKVTISAVGSSKTTSATLTLTVKQPVTITFANDNTFTYTGKAQKASVTTNPAGEPVTFVYTQNGKNVSPVAAGTYDVIATVDTSTLGGSADGTLTITPGTAIVTFTNLSATYTGKPIPVTVATSPSKLPVTISYDGSATAPSAVGIYDDVVAATTSPNYTGSATGTFTIAPIVTTGAATSVTGTTAVLNGTVSPKAAVTAVQFDYGITTSYGSTTTGTIGGSSPTVGTVTGALSGLTGSTLYHYRLEITSAAGTTYGIDHTFTTGKVVGAFFVASSSIATGADVTYRVTAGNKSLKVYYRYGTDMTYSSGVTYTQVIPAGGTASVSADLPGIEAGVTYYYELVMLASDGTLTYGPPETYTNTGVDFTEPAVSGDTAPDANAATWATFEDPILNNADGVAFSAMLKIGSGTTTGTGTVKSSNDIGVWADDADGNLAVVARTGTGSQGCGSPGIASSFINFGSPIYNDSGEVAFSALVATVSGTVTASNDEGIWQYEPGSGTFTGSLVARLDSQAANLDGVKFSSFTDVGLTQTAGTVIFAGLSGTGVTASNDFAILEGNSSADLAVKIRLGDAITYSTGTSTGTKTIKEVTYLSEQYLAASQTRNFNASGDLAVSALFTDGTTGLVKEANGTESIATLKGQPAPGINGATLAAFGVPAINNSGNLAFGATLTTGVGGVTNATDTGLFAQDGNGTLQNIAQTGIAGQAPLELPGQGSDTDSFFAFSDPVYNNNNAVAFAAVLNKVTGLVDATNEIGLYCTSSGTLQLVARNGEQAPGCPPGAVFSSFTTYALPDVNGPNNHGGLVFIGQLQSNSAVGITESNDTGMWAVDRNNNLQLILRVGDFINGKNVIGLNFLPYLAASDGQTRGVANGTGDLVALVTLSDKTSLILNVVYP